MMSCSFLRGTLAANRFEGKCLTATQLSEDLLQRLVDGCVRCYRATMLCWQLSLCACVALMWLPLSTPGQSDASLP